MSLVNLFEVFELLYCWIIFCKFESVLWMFDFLWKLFVIIRFLILFIIFKLFFRFWLINFFVSFVFEIRLDCVFLMVLVILSCFCIVCVSVVCVSGILCDFMLEIYFVMFFFRML